MKLEEFPKELNIIFLLKILFNFRFLVLALVSIFGTIGMVFSHVMEAKYETSGKVVISSGFSAEHSALIFGIFKAEMRNTKNLEKYKRNFPNSILKIDDFTQFEFLGNVQFKQREKSNVELVGDKYIIRDNDLRFIEHAIQYFNFVSSAATLKVRESLFDEKLALENTMNNLDYDNKGQFFMLFGEKLVGLDRTLNSIKGKGNLVSIGALEPIKRTSLSPLRATVYGLIVGMMLSIFVVASIISYQRGA